MHDEGDGPPPAGAMMAGLRVLVAEDCWLLADELTRALRAHGAEVVGPAPTLGQATGLADATAVGNAGRERLDGALLNVNLRGEMAYPLADALLSRGVPVVLVTGYDKATLRALAASCGAVRRGGAGRLPAPH